MYNVLRICGAVNLTEILTSGCVSIRHDTLVMDTNTTKARKAHKCSLCHREIKKGTEYIYARVTPWDHSDNEYFFDYRAHIKCDEAWNKKVGDEFGWLLPDDGQEFLDYAEMSKP